MRKSLVLLTFAALLLGLPTAVAAASPARGASGDLITNVVLDGAGVADLFVTAEPATFGTVCTGYSRPASAPYYSSGLVALFAPDGGYLWSRAYPNGYAYGVWLGFAAASDDAIYVAGRIDTDDNETGSVLVAKYETDGDRAWARVIDGPAKGDDEACGIVVSPSDGNPILVSTETMKTGGLGVVVRKLAGDTGAEMWRRVWNRSREDYVSDVTSDANGSVYIAGGTQSGSAKQAWDAFLLKVTNGGKLAWARVRDGVRHGRDEWSSVVAKGSYVYVAGDADYDRNGDVMVARYASSGAVRWLRTWGTAKHDEGSNAVAVTGKGDVVACGTQWSGAAMAGVLAKWNSGGVRGWAKVSTPGGRRANLTNVDIGPNGAIYAAGWIGDSGNSDWLLTKYSVAGGRAWAKTYHGAFGGDDYFGDMHVRGDLCILAGAMTTSATNIGAWFGRVEQ